MNKAVAALSVLCLAPAIAAQTDRIVWTDGTVTNECRVNDFTIKEVSYSVRGRTETRSSDAVANLEVEKVRDTYKRAFGAANDDDAYSAFLSRIKELGDKPFLAQFGYVSAAKLLMKNGQHNDAFAMLEEMGTKIPTAGFAPEQFRMKLDYYLSLGQEGARNAGIVAQKYHETAIKEAWPDGYVSEAAFYRLMARAASGEVDAAGLQTELRGLLGQTEGTYPSVADRVRIQLANAQRGQNQLDKAKQTYQEVLAKSSTSDSTRAQALVGLGYVHMQSGDPSNTEPYLGALRNFLKAYFTDGASADLKAEALFNASEAADKWRGPDSSAMARRLRGLLHRDYPDSTWSKK
jgi:tetratricopeptide (TPR) repeat protein